MRNINKMANALGVFQSYKKDIKIQHIRILLCLAQRLPESANYNELAKFSGLKPESMSRSIQLLGSKMVQNPKTQEWSNTGLGLIRPFPNPYNPREYVVELTDEGRSLLKKLAKALD